MKRTSAAPLVFTVKVAAEVREIWFARKVQHHEATTLKAQNGTTKVDVMACLNGVMHKSASDE